MKRRTFIIGGAGLISVAACTHILGPKEQAPYVLSPVSTEEHQQTLAHMSPPKRKRPVIAVLADNHGSETTDFIIPWSVLTRSNIADVYSVGLKKAPIKLMPALSIMPQMSVQQFSEKFPDGADYVIVPAFHNPKSPDALEWIKAQNKSDATMVGICSGALPLAYAGLLDGKQATTHWYSVKKLQQVSPTALWTKDRRYVADNGIVTSTGVSASLPLSLALVEAIAGKQKSDELAAQLNIKEYNQRHNSEYFKLRAGAVYRAAANAANVFGKEKIGHRLENGVDEISLALSADAWSRTYRSKYHTLSDETKVSTLNGLEIIPDRLLENLKDYDLVLPIPQSPGTSMEETLEQIQKRYGTKTALNVALQLEYPWTA